MTKAAKDKRWAIVPPPSPASSKVSGEFSLVDKGSRRSPARRFQVEDPSSRPFSSGFSFRSERDSSECITEVPSSGEDAWGSDERFSDLAADTIPAPSWLELEDE